MSYDWDLDNDGQYDDATGATTSATFIDDGNFPIALKVIDDQGASDIAHASVTVNNVAPTADAGPGQQVDLGETVTVDINFSDPGIDDGIWPIDIDWDDGTSDTGGAPIQTAPVSIGHIYGSAGTYNVQACVTDKDGDQGCDSLIIVVNPVGSLSPMALKQRALDSILPHANSWDAFELAIPLMQESLEPRFWIDDSHLSTSTTRSIFQKDHLALRELTIMMLINNNISQEERDWAQMAIDDTLTADRALAELKLQETESAPALSKKVQRKIERLLGKARNKLSEADTRRSIGDFGLAAELYGDAWKLAVKAMNLHMKHVP